MGRRRPSRRPTPWQRKNPENAPAADVLHNLEGRVFTNLEDCRIAWEKGKDPMALVFGLMIAEGEEKGLPPWLADDLLLILVADYPDAPALTAKCPHLRELWTARYSQAVDTVRAAAVLATRTHPTHPTTWDGAEQAGADRAVDFGAPHASRATAKKSYHKARHALTNEGTQWQVPGFVAQRLRIALLAAEERDRGE